PSLLCVVDLHAAATARADSSAAGHDTAGPAGAGLRAGGRAAAGDLPAHGAPRTVRCRPAGPDLGGTGSTASGGSTGPSSTSHPARCVWHAGLVPISCRTWSGALRPL